MASHSVKHQIVCETEANKIEFSHKWVIRDFHSTFKYTSTLNSPQFQIPENCGTGNLWLSIGYPEEAEILFDECPWMDEVFVPMPCVALNITLKSEWAGQAVVHVHAMASNGQKVEIEERNDRCYGDGRAITWNFKEFISCHKFEDWKKMRVGTVTIFCDFTIIKGIDSKIVNVPKLELPELLDLERW